MLTTVITSIAAYIGTAVDDLFILTLLFSQADDLAHRKHVLQGQCIGIAALTALSLLAAAGLQLLPPWAVGLMGLIPLALGVREWFRSTKADEETENTPAKAGTLLRVALLALANGADNIGVYAPLFAGFDLGQKMLCVLLFMVMTVLWCALAALIAAQPQLKTILRRYRRVLVPVVLMLLGLYILLTNLLPLFA